MMSPRLARRTPSVRELRLLANAALVAIALLGCAQQPDRASTSSTAQLPPSPWALPTSTMSWNEYACTLIAQNRAGQFPASRLLAYLNLAINNGIVAARQQGRKPDGAAAGAAAAVLAQAFPAEEQAITGRLARETAAIGADGRADFAAGVEIGRTAAAQVIASAKEDRSNLAFTGQVPSTPDKWISRAQPAQPPLGPRLGEMRTFFLTTGADFRAPAPPAVDSAKFRTEVAEVRAVSDRRTGEQLRIAQYWENLSGAFAAGQWNSIARDAISSHGLSEAEAARILAMMHMAGVDATIACHDSKYVYWVPRPTQVDSAIVLAIGVPNHPSYPSNHACISGTNGLVLDAMFPDQRGRYFAMGKQAGESRVYAGIHYRMDLDSGYDIAQKVAAKAVAVGVPADRSFVPLGR